MLWSLLLADLFQVPNLRVRVQVQVQALYSQVQVKTKKQRKLSTCSRNIAPSNIK